MVLMELPFGSMPRMGQKAEKGKGRPSIGPGDLISGSYIIEIVQMRNEVQSDFLYLLVVIVQWLPGSKSPVVHQHGIRASDHHCHQTESQD